MAQQGGTQATRWTCNYTGCTTGFSRLGDAQRHAAEFHRGSLLQCHVPGCRWPGAKRKGRVTQHMKDKHREMMSVVLEIPKDGSWPAAPSVAHDHSQNRGYGYNAQDTQPTSANASGSSAHALQPPYIPISSSALFSGQLDTNQYAGWQSMHSSSSQHPSSGGHMGQYDSDPTYDQYSSSNPTDGDDYEDAENEDAEDEAGHPQK
ncbi:hypothetical protein DL98DRAFT_654122 [Cadophora sp. DSE1049]|nr:hypothetical protein DL98DRAFT_654122 [Cadophora sp. DSE1049]